MKYIDAEKLKEELEMRKTVYIGHALSLRGTNLIDGFDEALSIIDSFQQVQPDVDIEKEIDITTEIEEHAGNMPHCEFSHYTEDEEDEEWAKKEFRHFYELGKKAK